MSARGDLAGAEALCREALAEAEKNCSPQLDTIGIAHMNLAAVLKKRGDLAAAETELRAELAFWENLYGHKSTLTASALTRLARLRQERGDLAQAEELSQQAVAITRVAMSDNIPVIGPLRALASLQNARGNTGGAITSLREAVDISRKNLPTTNNQLPICLNDLVASLLTQGEFSEAEKLQNEARAAENSLNYARSDVQLSLHENYANLYAAWAKTDPTKSALAAEWQNKLKTIKEAAAAKNSAAK